MAQNLYFTKLYNIPEMINHVDPAKNPQSTLVIFGNLLPKQPIFGFWAIILEPHQINPKFLHFLNALRCPDLGQEESQKVWSTFWITLVETLVPTVLNAFFVALVIQICFQIDLNRIHGRIPIKVAFLVEIAILQPDFRLMYCS